MRNPTAPREGGDASRRLCQINGFTLIELLITLAVIGVLAAFAYPSYTRYVTETRRSEGQRLLLMAAAQQEKFYTQCGWYASNFVTPRACNAAGNGNLGMLNNLPDVPNYTVAIAPGNTANIATSYLLTATPSGTQATNDTDCANLTLDSLGVKGQSGPNTQNRCWRR